MDGQKSPKPPYPRILAPFNRLLHWVTRAFSTRVDAERETERLKRLLYVQHQQTQSRIEGILNTITDAFYAVDQSWCFTFVNEKAARLFGRDPQTLIGKNLWEEFPLLVGTELDQKLRWTMREKRTIQFEIYASQYLKSWVDVNLYPSQNGLACYFRDVTTEHLAKERAELLQNVTAALVEAVTPEQISMIVIEKLFTVFDAYLGSMLLVSPDETVAEVIYVHGIPKEAKERIKPIPLDSPTPIADAVRTREPIWIESLEEYETRYPEVAYGIRATTGSQAICCVPMTVNGKVLGGIGISFTQSHSFNDDEKRLLITIAQQCAQALERTRVYELQKQAKEALEAASRRVQYLADAGRLLASSLDYETTLKNITRLVIPALADWCVIDLVEGEGYRRVAVAHDNPAQIEFLEALLEEYPASLDNPYGYQAVIKAAKSQIIPIIPEEIFEQIARDERHLQLIRQLRLKSNMCVPLIVRDRVLGAITFAYSESGRVYTREDLSFAEEMAQRIAVALDNAHLYRVEQEARANLEEEREKLTTILQQMPAGVIIADAKTGAATFMNQQVEKVLGYPALSLTRLEDYPRYKALHPDGTPYRAEEYPLARAILMGEVTQNKEMEYVHDDGQRQFIITNAAPIRNTQNEIVAGVLAFFDVTERKRAEQLNMVLKELAAALSKAATREEIGRIVIEKGVLRLGAHLGSISLISEDGLSLEPLVSKNISEQMWKHYQSRQEHTPLHDAINTGQAVWIEDQAEYLRRYPHMKEMLARKGSYSTACMPLFVNGNVIGGLGMSFTHPRQFTEAEKTFFVSLADRCSEALERARLYETELKLRQMAEEATARIWRLQALTAAFSETLTTAEVAEVVVRREFTPLGVHLGIISLLSDDGKYLELIGHYGVPEELLETYRRTPIDNPLPITDAVQRGEPVWLPSDNEYRAQYTDTAESTLPRTRTRALAALPLMVEGRAIGCIGMSFVDPQQFTEELKAFMMAIARQCAQALHRARLHQQAQIAAAAEERQRLARDLHDAVSQTLFSSTTMAEVIPTLWERNPTRGREQLAQMVTLNRAAMAEMRSLLLELRPDAIVRTSLSALLKQLEEAVKGRRNIETTLKIDGTEILLEPDVHVAFYRIAQEALNNTVKHSAATRVDVELRYSQGRCILRIQDNGKGFDQQKISAGMGMNTMRERAEAIGAMLHVQSEPGSGTSITLDCVTESQV